MKLTRVAVANRGEVAVRIIQALQEMNIESVLLHSIADVGSRAFRMADHKICIGGPATAESYLNIEANIQGAKASGAQAIHPGFGFLSENADFAEACEKEKIKFIGPKSASIRKLGDKVNAKALATSLGLPMVPGYQGENQDVDFLVQQAQKIGFPVIVKAAAGGGGRGMKVLRTGHEARELIESAQREAHSAFGSPKVFLEKYLDQAKHIEFQIFGDCTGRVIHLNDRECSVQRRHQKIIEEAISPSLTEDLRSKMGQAACAMAEAAGYQGAGTVEFLLQDGKYYFLEVNTRLQVEHTVTEMVMGVDLVKAQVKTAMNEPVFPDQDVRIPRGHSIECRIYTEDPELGGVPSIGTLGFMHWPQGPGRRFDCGFDPGDTITPFYDSMIAKIIVWDDSRPAALQKMQRVLQETVIFGLKTNIPLLQKIIDHPEFVSGKMTTRFMDQYFSEPLKLKALTPHEESMLKVLSQKTPKTASSVGPVSQVKSPSPFEGFWRGV